MLGETGRGVIFDYNDKRNLYYYLKSTLQNFSKGKLYVNSKGKDIRRFDRKYLTQELADIFDHLIQAK